MPGAGCGMRLAAVAGLGSGADGWQDGAGYVNVSRLPGPAGHVEGAAAVKCCAGDPAVTKGGGPDLPSPLPLPLPKVSPASAGPPAAAKCPLQCRLKTVDALDHGASA